MRTCFCVPMNKEFRTPVCTLPQYFMGVISYGLPTGLHTPSKSYGPGQPVVLMWSRCYVLFTWNPLVIAGPIGLGKPYGPLALENSVWKHPPATCMVICACIHAFTGFSLCFKHRISITHACPLSFHKGHVHVDVIWTRADAIRVLEYIYAKASKLPMQDPYGFWDPIRDPQGACTIMGTIRPIRRMAVYGSKCLEAGVWKLFSFQSHVMGKNNLKVVRVHTACRVITHGSSGIWPLRSPKTAQELNVTRALVINPLNDTQMVQIG